MKSLGITIRGSVHILLSYDDFESGWGCPNPKALSRSVDLISDNKF